MSTHALQKMARDRFRAMSLAPRQKCPRNVVQMKEAMGSPHVRESRRVLDSGFHTVDSGFRVLDSGFPKGLDSNFFVCALMIKPGSTRLSILVVNCQKPGKSGSTRVYQAHQAFNQTFGARVNARINV